MAKQKTQSGVRAGYVDTAGGSLGKPFVFRRVGDSLEGTIVSKKEIDAKQAKRKKAKPGEKVVVVTIAQKDTGEVFSIWESVGLKDFCAKAKPKMNALLVLEEIKNLGGGKTFKRFFAGLK